MARIDRLLATRRCISVELWPPRSERAAARLERSLEALEALRPDFASITYGAAGSTRERTHELVVALHRAGRLTPMAHLTCAAHERRELVEILERYAEQGVENVLALRGDPPLGAGPLPAGELAHAVDLVVLAKEVGDFCVAVAAHPGGHPEASSREADLDSLAAKLGVADFAITQFFFDAADYLALREALAARGIDKPVVPGVMPVTSVRTLSRMAELSGREPPARLAERVGAVGDDADAVRKVGVEIATALCEQLLGAGAPGLHFYTMNDVRATIEVCECLGLAGGGAAAARAIAAPPRGRA